MLNRWNVMKNAGKGTEVQSYSPGFPKPLWRPPHPPLSVFVEEIWRGHLMENPGCFFIFFNCEIGSSVNFVPSEKQKKTVKASLAVLGLTRWNLQPKWGAKTQQVEVQSRADAPVLTVLATKCN
jgi:hypothetical protein